MSWCPKCKNEYRAGITICPDCNEELVEELKEEAYLEFVPLFQTTDEELKNKLISYLVHCGHKIKEETGEEETDEGLQNIYSILVPKEAAKEALQEIHTVISYDAKQKSGDEAENPRSRVPEPSTVYVDAKARYQEYRSSGIMFLAFAVLFLLFGILNIAGIVTIMASTVSLVLLFAAVVGFTYVGITSLGKVSSLKEEASTEETTTESILTFLKEHYPKEVVETMTKEANNDETAVEEVTSEELYFLRMDAMKNHLLRDFPDKDENYLDALLEEYYNSLEL